MAGWYSDGDWDGLRVEYLYEILSDLFCALNERERLVGRGACTDAATPWGLAWTSYQDYEEGEGRSRPAAPATYGEPLTKARLADDSEKTDPSAADFDGLDNGRLANNVGRLRQGIEVLLSDGHERYGHLNEITGLVIYDEFFGMNPTFDTGFTAKFVRVSSGLPLTLALALSDAGYSGSDWTGSVRSDTTIYAQMRDVLNEMTQVAYGLGGTSGTMRGPCYLLNLADLYPYGITLKEGTGATLEEAWNAAVAASEAAVTVDTDEEEYYAYTPILPAATANDLTVKIWQMAADEEPEYQTRWVQGEIQSVVAGTTPMGSAAMPGSLAFTDAYGQTWAWPGDLGETPDRGVLWPDVGVNTAENPLRWDSLPATCPFNNEQMAGWYVGGMTIRTDLSGELVYS